MEFAPGPRSVIARIEPEGSVLRSPSDAEALRDDAPVLAKYGVVGPIGQGGMGEVLLVQDRDLRRDVAMKVLRPEFADQSAMRRRFVAEAQATSQLEHPGIPPVHDIGVADDGRVYFTMKVVRGKTLTQVLRELFLGAKETRLEFTLHKLMTVLERIAEAVHFAHERGVIHRDLKPDNVMLGEYGEVHVMDWGIAKIGDAEETSAPSDSTIRTIETDAALLTQAGTVKGTIPYMSPEQARGEALDRRTDVYALGAILYEMLTLQRAFEGDGVSLVLKVRSGDHPPVESRNPRRSVPEALAAMCRRAMARDPSQRPATAHQLAEELRVWLDGRADLERRHREAESLAARGRRAMSDYVSVLGAIEAAEREAAQVAESFRPWQAVAECAPSFAARRRVSDLHRDAALAFAETTRLLEAALVAESDNANARSTLGELWRGRLDEAETRGSADDAAHALTMVRRYDDGALEGYLGGDGSLELTSEPQGAEVSLVRFTDEDGILVAGTARSLGRTPLPAQALPMGSYLAVLTRPGFADVRYPVHITRNRAWRARIRLRTRREIGDGFVLVPAGPFACGESHRMRTLELAEFAIAERPTTFRDWASFLAAVEAEQGIEAARKLVPSVRGDGDYMARTEDARWVALPITCEGATRERCLREYGPGFEMLLPVSGISWHEAVAYCEWKSRTTGSAWRLPTEEEREKAARGVDGRLFPWGDLEHATLGKCGDSRPEIAQPEPVGAFPSATSVYGAIDASGNSFDWTDSWFDGRRTFRVARGGAWLSPTEQLRCAHRNYSEPSARYAMVGLRCARDLDG